MWGWMGKTLKNVQQIIIIFAIYLSIQVYSYIIILKMVFQTESMYVAIYKLTKTSCIGVESKLNLL